MIVGISSLNGFIQSISNYSRIVETIKNLWDYKGQQLKMLKSDGK